jgi:solute carrier family 13 (sodium-dependent dicarboxylate transporter), member 2/3/5
MTVQTVEPAAALGAEAGQAYDPLDMHNYRFEHLPTRDKSPIEQWLASIGVPAALAVFVLFALVIKVPFLQGIDASSLVSGAAVREFERIGAEAFSRSNAFTLAIFLASLILWITNALPNYLTSLIVIISLVLTGVLSEQTAYAQLGHPVMWLNIMSFVLASMLVATGVAKRFALWFILRFGKNASTIFLSFIVINLVLSAFISATTAKAAILLPIFMVIAAIYGARPGPGRNNFGRSIVLQNLLNVNLGASAFVTGSGANLLAAALISGAIGGSVFFADWMVAMLPGVVGLMLVGYLLAMKVFFPLAPEEQVPSIAGGMDRLRAAYDELGPMNRQEVKSVVIFLLILGFWATDRLHGVSATSVAFVGAIVALLPRYGIVKWNEVDIPWHLMLFSAGAYTLGAALAATDLPLLSVNAFFDALGIGTETSFRHALHGTYRHDDPQCTGLPVEDHAHHGVRANCHRRGQPLRLQRAEPGPAGRVHDRTRVRAAVQQQAGRTALRDRPVQPDERIQVRLRHDGDRMGRQHSGGRDVVPLPGHHAERRVRPVLRRLPCIR